MFIAFAATFSLVAQDVASTKSAFEPKPVLNASEILRPEYRKGFNFTVRDQVPTNAGWNYFTIDSDYGVFEASGNMMLMRRVSEIAAIGAMRSMSENKEFMNAVEKSAKVPLNAAQSVLNDPVNTISSVPKGIFGFLSQTGQSVSDTLGGRKTPDAEGNAVENISGFSKVKRDLAIRLGVDPYSSNETFQKELTKAAWPIFLGNITVQAGMSCVAGPAGKALSAFNMTGEMENSLRELNPTQLRMKNLASLAAMGISKEDSNAFLDNLKILPSSQTVIVNSLMQLGNIPGRNDFIHEVSGSDSELMSFSYQYTAEMMAKLSSTSPLTAITHTVHLTVCQNKDGTLLIPIEWDYAEWSPSLEAFVPAVKELKMPTPATGNSLVITGVVSPTTARELAARNMTVVVKALPGPLK